MAKRYTLRGRDSGAPSVYYVTWEAGTPSTPYPGSPPFGGPITDVVVVRDGGGGGGAAYGLSSARPAASGSSNQYYCTDLGIMYIDDPTTTSWQIVSFQPLGLAGTSPISGGFTALGSISTLARGDALLVSSTVANVDSNLYKAWPSGVGAIPAGGPWKLTMSAQVSFQQGSTYPGFGVFISNGVTPLTSYSYFAGTYNYSGNAMSFGAWFAGMNSQARAYGSGIGTNSAIFNNAPVGFWRIVCDGTNYAACYSLNGSNWVVGTAVAKSSGPAILSPTHYGITCGCVNGSGLANGTVYTHELASIPQITVTGASYSSPSAVLTTSGADHGIYSGDTVSVTGITVASGTNPNTTNAVATRISATQLSVPVAGTFAYTSGGLVTLLSR